MARSIADYEDTRRDIGRSISDSSGVRGVLARLLSACWWVGTKFLWVLWLCILVLVATCVFWALDTEEAGRGIVGDVIKCRADVDPAEAQCIQDKTSPPGTAEPGDRTLTRYQFQVERTDCTLFFIRETKDAAGFTWPTSSSYVTILPRKTGVGPINFTMMIPMDATAGAADFQNRYGWWCNPWQWAWRAFREHELPPVTITVIRK